MMYKDIINYDLAENCTEANLLTVAKKVVETWMKHQEGFISWEIHKNKDGAYTDIVYWESEAAAKKSEKNMSNIPNAAEWFACYKTGSIKSQNLNQLIKL